MSFIDCVYNGDQLLVRLSFDSHEAELLADIAAQFIQLLTDAPDDRAATQLFPAGYADSAAQAEYSRFTRDDLSERKIASARAVVTALTGPAADAVSVELTPDAAWNWLTFLTDIRFVLAERIRSSADEPEHEVQERVYDWTSHLQERIVQEMSGAAESTPTHTID